MKLPTLLVLVLLAGPALAGCLDAGPSTSAETGAANSAGRQEETAGGRLLVAVVTPDLRAIADARVTVGNQTVVTDSAGGATFEGLRPGRVLIEARKEGFRPATAAADIRPGEEATVRIKLLAGSDAVPAGAGNTTRPENYTEEFSLNGYFDCSATYLIITGDCLLVLDAGLDELNNTIDKELGQNVDARPGVATNEKYLLEFPLDLHWKFIDVEMDWTSLTPLGDQMTLAIEPAQAPADGHAAKYAVTNGASPLRLRLEAGVAHPNATASADGEKPDMPNALGGEVLRTRSYVQGFFHRPAGTGFLGLGATVLQRFQVLVTVHYVPSMAEEPEAGKA